MHSVLFDNKYLTKRCTYDYHKAMGNSVLRNIDELGELVVIEYSKSYDLDIAMMKAEVSEEEKKLLLSSTSFMYQLEYQDALIREEIIDTMVNNMRFDRKGSQKAAVDLGNILYRSKFDKKDESTNKAVVPDVINLVGV